jgi:hypothetical protein
MYFVFKHFLESYKINALYLLFYFFYLLLIINMKLFTTVGVFLVGVYIGQEYNEFPNIKVKTLNTIKVIKDTDIYKEIFKKN